MLVIANHLDGGQDGSHLPTHHKSSVHVCPDTPPPQIVSSPHLSLTARFDHCFLKSLEVSFSRVLHHPRRLTNWVNLSVSERSYGIEFWPFPGQNFSLGDAITRLGRSLYRDTKNLGDQSIKPCKRL